MFLKSKGDFVFDVGGADGRGRKNHQQTRTIVQGILDRARPPLTRRDVQLIQPHVRPGRFQACGQPKGEFRIVPAVAEKSCLCLCCQADLPVPETYGKDIVADMGKIAPYKTCIILPTEQIAASPSG